MFTKSVAFAGLASMASAHILMTFPAPYAQDGPVINAPLHDKHSPAPPPFPCGTTNFGSAQATTFQAGSTQSITFKGTATHGGGSCQFSVTTDMTPTTGSVWKVIKSIEGGCPVRNQPGNMPGDSAELPLPEGYPVEIPNLPEGSYTFAWSWFNKVGNREMYMNCAPIQVTGGDGSVDLNSLPDMLVANVPQSSCATIEGQDVQFPNPGSNLIQMSSGPFGGLTGDCGSKSGGDVIVNPVTPAPQDPAPVPQQPAPVPQQPAPAPPAGGACTEGNWNCIDGTSYSRCAAGAWSAAMPVAAGTTCVVGESASLTLA